MKCCPECDSTFPDTYRFCELDGTTLVAESLGSNPVPGDRVEQELWPVLALEARDERRRREQYLQTLALVAIAAVAIGLVLFLVYQGMTREAPNSSNEPATNTPVAQQQIPVLPLRPAAPIASASPSPSVEPSPSPSATASPPTQAERALVALSSSPVSTGGEKTRPGQVTIRLTNGTSVAADEVWETREGIWYRWRGVVTLLERNQVKEIEKAAPAASSPAATSATTPESSSVASP